MANNKQRLVLSILDFLSESMTDGTVKEEDKEGLEVAGLCTGLMTVEFPTRRMF